MACCVSLWLTLQPSVTKATRGGPAATGASSARRGSNCRLAASIGIPDYNDGAGQASSRLNVRPARGGGEGGQVPDVSEAQYGGSWKQRGKWSTISVERLLEFFQL